MTNPAIDGRDYRPLGAFDEEHSAGKEAFSLWLHLKREIGEYDSIFDHFGF